MCSVVKPNPTFATATKGGVTTNLEPDDFTVLFAGTNYEREMTPTVNAKKAGPSPRNLCHYHLCTAAL